MFKKGDVIVYPNQGVGVIDSIENREFKGDTKTFYNIQILNNSLKLMMLADKVEDSNARLISNLADLNASLEKFKEWKPDVDKLENTNGKERLETNSSKIKSGTFEDFLEVYSDLLYVRRQHSLNSSENQMFNKTRKILIEEISQVKGISRKDAEKILLPSSFN